MSGSTVWPNARTARIIPANAAGLAEGARLLQAEKLVAFPTETVYGLGADASCDAAVARIYAAKGRPAFNPLISHVASLAEASRHGIFSAAARRLAETFWPGPLTLVLPVAATNRVCELARAGRRTVALRVPAHKDALALIAAAGLPIAAPSANRSGRVSPVTARHVAEDLGDEVDLILDGGACHVGVESTIVACLGETPQLLRPGGLSRAVIEEALGLALPAREASSEIVAPGALASHYAPRALVRLDAEKLEPGEAGLDFGGRFTRGPATLDLSPAADLDEAAANLFAFLRELDAGGPAAIAVAPIPRSGIGEAINDRLKRAAAPRA
ncbi:Sua5/YciO/YrdC/YwlC family protein [Methylocella silvestris BL2]|uniref:Threonylcarbamoyl-AMP synthase n=1 Tax=Methylocella silvestris (strain DSM 15510 / CIP 108128 / LMG 27833 / NCIMB 13906 / BL2) TaxID=395965 RepID=B8EJL5_METSB|nr:L-threonylcarbamoyladenylate synthase [Methylocella silvestris]ACK49419.1 Sua5/YciO/YrdC/YwlC family protein [Methylocella silvestris BL2]